MTGSSGGRPLAVFAAVSAVLFFVQATTYASLGVALFPMVASLGWSPAIAGTGFTVLVLATCVASLGPVPLIRRGLARWAMAGGCATLAVAFLLASQTHAAPQLYIAVALAGVAFAMTANTPGTYLLAGWAGDRAPRLIGFYMTIGGLGSAVGPPLVQALIEWGGWRFYWLAAAFVAAVLAVACAVLIREPVLREVPPSETPTEKQRWLRSPTYWLLAASLVATQICTVTVASVAPAALQLHGWTPMFAAQLLGLQGLIATVATGISGMITRHLAPRRMLAGALLLEAIGMLLLAEADGRLMLYAFALSFGIGWSVVTLAVTILLVEHFGERDGTAGLATIWMLSGAAAIGPWAAALTLTANGSVAPALMAFGVVLVPLAIGALRLKPAPPPRGGEGWGEGSERSELPAS